jgi:two-component system OmpR family sensor kinase/two-component system sensor histidine kinase BaeS
MRLRLFLSFTLIVLVSILSMVLAVRLSAQAEVRAWMFHGGMRGLDSLAIELEDYYQANGSWQGVEDLFDAAGHGGGGMGRGMGQGMNAGIMNQRLRLADAQGNLLVDTREPVVPGQVSQAELADAIKLVVAGRTAGYLLPEGGVSIGAGAQTGLLTRLNRAAWVAALLAGAMALILAWLVSLRLLRPVSELTRAARQLAQGDLAQRVVLRGKDELASLGRAFNHMAASLQQSEESRRAMTADIAHELRTPLAVQRAHLEALQDGIYPMSSENLTPILEQNQLLTRLVEDLRTLALADAGQLPVEKVPTDLVALVKRVTERFLPQAVSKSIHLELDIHPIPLPPFALFALDPARIEQLLGNLLVNALRYTPEGGKIILRLLFSPSAAQITVRDTGPGIAQEDLQRVFERFYRADRSRSRAEGGSGLGLAIARQIAQMHGATLVAGNHPQGGAIFTLTIPI